MITIQQAVFESALSLFNELGGGYDEITIRDESAATGGTKRLELDWGKKLYVLQRLTLDDNHSYSCEDHTNRDKPITVADADLEELNLVLSTERNTMIGKINTVFALAIAITRDRKRLRSGLLKFNYEYQALVDTPVEIVMIPLRNSVAYFTRHGNSTDTRYGTSSFGQDFDGKNLTMLEIGWVINEMLEILGD